MKQNHINLNGGGVEYRRTFKLSVCIVAYHNHEDILNTVESIEKFTDSAISKRIFIVDNSDTNKNTRNTDDIKGKIKSFSGVEYLDVGSNLGFGKGHNYVLPILDSEYHAIVNPDILLRDNAFSTILRYMERHEDVGMVVPGITNENGRLQPVYREELTVFDMFIRMFCRKLFPKRIAKHTLQSKDFTKPFQVPFAQGSFLVVRTELFKDLGGFDGNFFLYVEDADFCRRVNLVSKLMYLPDASVIHQWKKGSHKDKNLFICHVKSMKYYFKKWGLRWI